MFILPQYAVVSCGRVGYPQYVEYLPPMSRLYAAISFIIHPLHIHLSSSIQFHIHPQQRNVLSVHPLHECSCPRHGIRTPDRPSDMGGCVDRSVVVVVLLLVTTRCVTMIRHQTLGHVFALCEQGLLCWYGEEETFQWRGRSRRKQHGSNSVDIVGCADELRYKLHTVVVVLKVVDVMSLLL